MNPQEANQIFSKIQTEIAKQIVGQERLIERLIVALVANGHVLLEGVPGLAKTLTLKALAECLDATMQRIQFTPDLLPSDLVGTEVYRPNTAEFVIRKGPIFANIVVADEINRAPAKIQSALLQAMQEREVTIGEQTFQLPKPFLVLATQNPIEQEGTYPLPEAQLDRFVFKVVVTYPSYAEEVRILKVTENSSTSLAPLSKVITAKKVQELQAGVSEVFVDERVDRYIVSLVQTSRNVASIGLKGMVDWGASPRGSIALRAAARALAFIRGKAFLTPDEVKEIAPDVLRHRILPSFEAEARGVTSDSVVETLLKSVAVP